MLFSEIYSSYYNVVAAILKEATRNSLTGQMLNDIVQSKAFAESNLTIPASLKEKWPLLLPDMTTPIQHEPSMPLTTLQRQWLKALLQDKRIALFNPNSVGLEDVEPLFDPSDIIWYDQYLDGDPYDDPTYVKVFHKLLMAIKEKRWVKIRFDSHTGIPHTHIIMPYRIEYSAKDDKFRVLGSGNRSAYTVNIARIKDCTLMEQSDIHVFRKARQRLLVFRLVDERNALERILLHFSHFEKETVRLDDRSYQVTLHYEKDDETELLIRVLSFGPMIKVIAPHNFIELVKKRLTKQQSCGL